MVGVGGTLINQLSSIKKKHLDFLPIFFVCASYFSYSQIALIYWWEYCQSGAEIVLDKVIPLLLYWIPQ